MKFFLFFILAGAPFLAQAQTSYVQPARVLRASGTELSLSGEYFRSSYFIDSEGKSQSLGDGNSFQRIQSEVMGLYGATSDLQFGVGARFRYHEARLTDTFGNQIDAGSAGLQSTFVSAKYGFAPQGGVQTSAEGMFRFTPYTNAQWSADDQGALVLGDDGNEYQIGLVFSNRTTSGNFFSIRTGFRSPGRELANEIYWQAEGALVWSYVSLVAGVDGVTSLGDDPYGGNFDRRPVVNIGNSRLYNSVNREFITPYLGLNLALGESWRLEARGSQVVQGRSTDVGQSFSLHLARRAEVKESKLIDSKFKEYDIEAAITRLSPQKGYVVIDKGITSDVRTGMRFDFFEFDYVGGNVLVARGVVTQVKAESAIVRITQRYNMNKQIKTGLVGRASIK